jgi:hypothetical protein
MYTRKTQCRGVHVHTFHQLDALSDVILILALDEVPGISELNLICEAILSDTLTILFLMSLKEQQMYKETYLIREFQYKSPPQ